MFSRPHCVLRDRKTLRATLEPAACFFTNIWRNYEVHLGINHDVPIAWLRYLMSQLLNPFWSFLSCLLSQSIHGKTRNHRVPHELLSKNIHNTNFYMPCGTSHEVEIKVHPLRTARRHTWTLVLCPIWSKHLVTALKVDNQTSPFN